ncbi:MAG: ATPase, T2SS/T4P/T4SS family, partial [Oceanobacter sp.]
MAVLTGIPRRLVQQELLSEEQAQQLVTTASEQGKSFTTVALESGTIKPLPMAKFSAQEFGLPLFDLAAYDTEFAAADLISADQVEKFRVVPLMVRGSKLFIAQADPSNYQAVDEIKFSTGLTVETVVVEFDKLQSAVERLLNSGDNALDDLGEELDVDLEDPDAADKEKDAQAEANPGDDAPIVRFVNKVLLDAIKMGSSDIHFEPYEKRYRVRFRTDGVLHEVTSPPTALSTKIAARLKVMSSMDLSERRIPQDGRIKMRVSKNKAIDFRVNTLPTLFGEKIVLRILDPSSAQLGIDMLGYEPEQKALYMDALSKPQGMILVTGPTGSGKTVSLYTG